MYYHIIKYNAIENTCWDLFCDYYMLLVYKVQIWYGALMDILNR